MRLRNLDGHCAVGGFTDQFKEQHFSSLQDYSTGNTSKRVKTAADIQVDDIIVAVGNLDALSPRVCPFEKVLCS